MTPGWKTIPIPVYHIASGYFARCDGIEKCFPRYPQNFSTHKKFPGAVFFAPYGFSWRESFSSEYSAVNSLCRFLQAAIKTRLGQVVALPRKVEPGFWVILATHMEPLAPENLKT